MTGQVLYYESEYNLQECIKRITEEPQEYACKWGTPLCATAWQMGKC